jgi:hypothetical protein
MLRAKFAYDVRHVARVHHANIAGTCGTRATRDVTFGPLYLQYMDAFYF